MLADAFYRYPRWWVEVLLRVRMSVLHGQTAQHRLPRTPPGEVVARAMDADRYARYADRWVDFVNGLRDRRASPPLLAGTWLAGAVLLAVMVASALASALGRPIAGRSAAAASTARARFGRSLVSVLESARTVKLAAATPAVHAHLQRVDAGRVAAAVREHRVQAVLDGVPMVMVQCGVVAAWVVHVAGGWGLATTLLVANAVSGLRLVRPGGRHGRHRGARHPRLAAGDQPVRRRRRPDGPARPASTCVAGTAPAAAGRSSGSRCATLDPARRHRRPRRRHHRRAATST